jgi:hypothetical protein
MVKFHDTVTSIFYEDLNDGNLPLTVVTNPDTAQKLVEGIEADSTKRLITIVEGTSDDVGYRVLLEAGSISLREAVERDQF